MNHYDFIILGGGCSGLSLAIQHAEKDPDKKILILENRAKYVADRTWCFWDVESHRFDSLVKRTWNKWQVRYKGNTLLLDSGRYKYCCIKSQDFYKEAASQLALLPNVKLLMSQQVTSVSQENNRVYIKTADSAFSSSIAFDSIIQKNISSCMYQHFLGWEVVVNTPVFEQDAITLMDFDVDQSNGLHFMYVLPYSPTRALIESTFISDKILSEETYRDAIVNYLEVRYKTTNFTVVHKERGVLPLGVKPKNNSFAKIVPIGANAGWMRASTGYAFLPIQREIRGLLFPSKKGLTKKIDSFLDAIFLSYIKEHPEVAPGVFFMLFKKNQPDSLVRFLTSTWSFLDLLKVVLTMPKFAMIKKVL